MTMRGSCHCGAVAYSLDDDLTEAMQCNCSICRPDGKEMVAVNLRCVEGLDLKSVKITPYDGASA